MAKIGFLGAGNMGGAIVSGIVTNGGVPASDVYVHDIHISREIAALGVNVTDVAGVLQQADMVVLAVKPNVFGEILPQIKSTGFDKKTVFVSIAAGIPIAVIQQALGADAKIVRVMPNLPLKVGAGMTVVSRCDAVDDTELARAKALFDCVGETVVLPESYIDKSLAVNGSSPAYVCMFIEALADGAVKNGVDRKSAYLLAEQSVLGTAKLLLETGLHPAELKDMVCSPAGTTIEAVAALERSGFRNAVLDAVEACTKKAMEMSGK